MSTGIVQLLMDSPDVSRVVVMDDSVMLRPVPGYFYVVSNHTEHSLVDGKHWRHNGRRTICVDGSVRFLKNYYVDDRPVFLYFSVTVTDIAG